MTHEQLTEILSQHKLWLENSGGQRADLRGAYLRGAYLRGADLSGAKCIMQFGPMPTSGRIIYFIQHESKIMVRAGCFWGTIDELEQAVKAKHNCPMYLGIIALVREQWKPIHN